MRRRGDLITDRYCEMQRMLHAAPRGYGQNGDKWADVVRDLISTLDCWSVLDYGCGRGSLTVDLKRSKLPGLRYSEYDPAIAGKDQWPDFADLVVCTDVLEHIEPELLSNVLQHIRTLARKAVWAVVSTCRAEKVLADGRNAHIIIESGDWWRARVEAEGFCVEPAPQCARQRPDKEWMAVLRP